jgi:hypothetical protein
MLQIELDVRNNPEIKPSFNAPSLDLSVDVVLAQVQP